MNKIIEPNPILVAINQMRQNISEGKIASITFDTDLLEEPDEEDIAISYYLAKHWDD